MKKLYSKPTAELIDFSLSTSVAGNCNSGSGYDLNGWGGTLLSDSCSVDTDDKDFCEHVPTVDGNVLSS